MKLIANPYVFIGQKVTMYTREENVHVDANELLGHIYTVSRFFVVAVTPSLLNYPSEW